jgi:hypothetical protein
MPTKRRMALLFAGVALAAAGLVACSNNGEPGTVQPNVPASISAVEHSSVNARALTQLGYTPVYQLSKPQKGYIWAVCPKDTIPGGTTTDLTTCSKDVNLKGDGARPTVFMIGTRIVYLQSRHRHVDAGTATVVYVTVPDPFPGTFGSLDQAQQLQILGLAQLAQNNIDMAPTTTLYAPIGPKHHQQQYQFMVRVGTSWPLAVS